MSLFGKRKENEFERTSGRVAGSAVQKMGGSAINFFTTFGHGHFKGIRHPDDTIDPRTRWLYAPPSRIGGLGRRTNLRQLYFGSGMKPFKLRRYR